MGVSVQAHPLYGSVAQLVEQRSPKSPVGGSNPSALDKKKDMKNAAMTMDAKLNQTRISTNASTQQASKKKRVFNYIQELKDELKKVSWTAKGELKLSTKIVIGATFLFGLGIYLFDLVIKGCLDFIAIVAHYIFG